MHERRVAIVDAILHKVSRGSEVVVDGDERDVIDGDVVAERQIGCVFCLTEAPHDAADLSGPVDESVPCGGVAGVAGQEEQAVAKDVRDA